MNPGLVVKLRPAGPWRIGPDSGARNRVDVIYHSDSLYAAVSGAMSRLGSLAEWLDATAKQTAPAVCFSSCFPFLDEIGFVIPPRTIWPPTSPALMSARVRWKSARFVPLGIVQAILAGQTLDGNHWSVDGPSECLVPTGRVGPFRTGVRFNAAVDRLTGAVERHSTACIEFRRGSGLWTVVSFRDEAAHERWAEPVKAAFRLLADTGFGGERSRGWGRSEAPEFIDGMLPDMILPPLAAHVEAAPAEAAPVEEPGPLVEPAPEAVAHEEPRAPEPPREPPAGEAAAEPTAASAEGAPEVPPLDVSPEPAPEAEPPAAHAEEPAPEAAPESAPAEERPSEPVVASVKAPPEIAPLAVTPEPTTESETMPLAFEPEHAEPESAPQTLAPAPQPPAPEAESSRPPAPESEAQPPAAAPQTPGYWLLSLFTPAPSDAVDWHRGSYTILVRGGRVDSPAGSGELKKQVHMVAEGSVLAANEAPCGAAPDVAPEGFPHPVFRAGFAVAVPLPGRKAEVA